VQDVAPAGHSGRYLPDATDHSTQRCLTAQFGGDKLRAISERTMVMALGGLRMQVFNGLSEIISPTIAAPFLRKIS